MDIKKNNKKISPENKTEAPKRKTQMNSSEMTPEMRKALKRKTAQRKMILNNLRNVSLILAVVISVSVLIAFVAVSCVNDVLAISVPEKDRQSVSVEISEGMNTSAVIDALDDAGAIKNAWFCKLAAKFFGYSDEGYIARTYEFNRSMGLENMLNEIKNNTSKTAKTVTLTFPEGYNADQIINLLVQNSVCTKEKMLEAINNTDFSAEFDFLADLTNVSSRYNYLEGYLFPDTYEFYIGEDPVSVLNKFLNNFKNKWTDNYSQKADELGMSVDEVVRLASVIEKEAIGADMPIVASILHNRLYAGMRLECDSTSIYPDEALSGLGETELEAYHSLYDTYICGSLPVGAICNPGVDAIDAVLNYNETHYYYFIHDRNNTLRVARTLAEHENNIAVYGLAS